MVFDFRKKSENKKALAKLRNMMESEWYCSGCGQTHHGLPDLAFDHPDAQGSYQQREPNSALRTDENFWSEDFCILEGKTFIIRTILEIPVKGLDKAFGFGTWSSLSKENFDIYIENFDSGFEKPFDYVWFSWFLNDLRYFGNTFSSKTQVTPKANRARPTVKFVDEAHPIYQAQENGLQPTELLDIYKYHGCFPA